MSNQLTRPAFGGDSVPSVHELQGLRVSLLSGTYNTGVMEEVSGMTGKSIILSALFSNGASMVDITGDVQIFPGFATGTLTLDTVVEDETADVHDVTFTFKDNPGPSYTEVQVGASDAESAANLAAAINAYFGAPGSNYLPVHAEAQGAVVVVAARQPGTASNAILIAGSTQITASAATLEGGTDDASVLFNSDNGLGQVILMWYQR